MNNQISVVIPTHNRAGMLPRAIASVQAQTIPVREIIVADDASSDGTAVTLAEIARSEKRLHVIECSRGGANRARNAGIAKASGEWIAFLDSDDYWEPEKLAAQLAVLATDANLIAAFTGLAAHAPHRSAVFVPRPRPSLFDLRCCNALSGTSSALVKAQTLHAVGGFDPVLPSCQDWDLWFRLRRIGPFGVVQKPLVHIDAGPHPRITTDRPSVMEGHRILFERLRDGLPPGPELRRVEAAHQLVLAELDRRAGNYRQSLPNALGAYLRSPSFPAVRSIARNISAAMRQALAGS